MQCFQKDHNLRVSARKLLKHPWIVNACRSDSVIPKKSTEYSEAVKSVQQWNEALKSPTSSLRKTSRTMSSSPVPPRRDRQGPAISQARSNLLATNQKANPDQFRSPNVTDDDNWDDDFASAINPSALQLPHLKPQDHYGGLLSAQNLKAFASFESVTEEAPNWDENFEGDLTVKSPLQLVATDALKKLKSPVTTDARRDPKMKTTPPAKSPKKPASRGKSRQSQDKPGKVLVKKTQTVAKPQPKPTLQYQEDPEEDYSDLILANDGAFESGLILNKASKTAPIFRNLPNMSVGARTSFSKSAAFNSFSHATTNLCQSSTNCA